MGNGLRLTAAIGLGALAVGAVAAWRLRDRADAGSHPTGDAVSTGINPVPRTTAPHANAVDGVLGVRPARPAGGVRVLTVNIHQAVPEGLSLGNENERATTLADLGRYVADLNPDIVLVQEVRDDHVSAPGEVPEQFERVGTAIGATDGRFGAAMVMRRGPDGTALDRYGDAIYVRNGLSITDFSNIELPAPDGPEPRRLLLAKVETPGGRQAWVGNMHLDHTGLDNPEQLDAAARIARQLTTVGRTTVRDADLGRDRTLTGRMPLIVGGDLNAGRSVVDPPMAAAGMRNVLDSEAAAERYVATLGRDHASRIFAPTYQDRRIDHLLTSADIGVTDTWVEEVPMVETVDGSSVTDHRVVIADIQLPDAR